MGVYARMLLYVNVQRCCVLTTAGSTLGQCRAWDCGLVGLAATDDVSRQVGLSPRTALLSPPCVFHYAVHTYAVYRLAQPLDTLLSPG